MSTVSDNELSALVDSIDVPTKAGSITARQRPSGELKGVVVCIENLHRNFSVQRNIVQILEHLAPRHHVTLVCTEGGTREAEGTIDVSWMSAEPDHFDAKGHWEQIRRNTADYLMSRGEMPGCMHFVVNHPELGVALVGLEKLDLYTMNIDATKKMAQVKDEAAHIARKFEGQIFLACEPILSSDLFNFFQIERAYHKQAHSSWTFTGKEYREYLDRLYVYAKMKGMIVPDTLIHELVALGILQANHGQKRTEDDPISNLSISLKNRSLDEDENQLRYRLLDLLCQTDADRVFRSLMRTVELLPEAFQAQLTPERARRFLRLNPQSVRLECLNNVDRLNRYLEAVGSRATHKRLVVPRELDLFFDQWSAPSTFYWTAKTRTHVMAQNIAGEMERRGENRAFAVIGGFHTADCCRDLVTKYGLACVVITPNVEWVESPWWDLMADIHMTEQEIEEETAKQVDKFIATLGVLVGSVLLAVAVFVSAGTMALPTLWAYLTLTTGFGIANIRAACDHIRPPPTSLRRGVVSKLLFVAVVLVAALDVGRFHWGGKLSTSTELVSLTLFALTQAVGTWAVRANFYYFCAPVLMQKQRGYRVITDGPYRYIRHPGYLAVLLGMLTAALGVGSWIALIPAVLFSSFLIWRTALEDRFLREHVPIYEDYATSVRYRLFPWVW